MTKIQNTHKKNIERHYHSNEFAELPKIRIGYSDSNRSIEIEISDYNLDNAFNSALYILDKRLSKHEFTKKDNPKEEMIG